MALGLARVKRFWRSVNAKLDADDLALLRRRLSPGERALFLQMDRPDQRHALDVARAVERAARDRGIFRGEDLRILVRAALLHDIGRLKGDAGLWERVCVVLLQTLAPRRLRRLVTSTAREVRVSLRYPTGTWSRLRRAVYVQWVHPRRGAYMARVFGAEEPVVTLIRRHHLPPRAGDSPLLGILQQVDRRY